MKEEELIKEFIESDTYTYDPDQQPIQFEYAFKLFLLSKGYYGGSQSKEVAPTSNDS